MKVLKILVLVLIVCLTMNVSVHASSLQVDPEITSYSKSEGVQGNLNSIGSDTLNNLMTFWAEGFRSLYPNVKVQIEGKGSSTAPPALIEGTAQLGPMSREMKSDEEGAFEKKFGYKPTSAKVAIDALAVFVHKDNPIECLSMDQLDGVFSSTRKRGGSNIDNWGQVGLTETWTSKPVSIYGRNSASGTYGYFKEVVLQKGDYKNTVKEQPGSSSVVQGIAKDLNGIGYSGIGYKTSGVKAVNLKGNDGQCYEASIQNAISGKYPLSRFLYVYINKKPGEPIDTLTKEFLTFVQSKQGQEIVIKDGYYPLPANISKAEIQKLAAK